MMRPSWWILFVVLLASAASGSTFYVPDHFPSIQAAIEDNAVVDNDLILVRAGTYLERINFRGKNIALRSESGAAQTVIDGMSGGDVVTFENGETEDAVLEGFTLTNGGNGITTRVDFVSPGPIPTPRIKSNLIEDNADFGLCDYFSDRSIYPIRSNYPDRSNYPVRSGGLMRIEGNTIRNNGAGICFVPDWYGTHGSAIIENNIIVDNAGTGISGGAFPSPIAGNIIMRNMGGGISLRGIIMTVTLAGLHGNVIAFNETPGFYGAGVHLNCVFCPDMSNNTFYGNFTEGSGAAVALISCYFCDIRNCLFWNNCALESGDSLYVDSGTSVAIDYSLMENGQAGVFVNTPGSLVWGDAMPVPADPRFVDAGNGDFHITRYSCCVNRGTHDVGAAFDMDGDPLPAWGTPDIGADEFTGSPLLASDAFTLSAATGGTIELTLLARGSDAGRTYLILGTLSGTCPGTPAPGQGVVIPVNMDLFTTSMILPLLNTSVFFNFMNSLDAAGRARAAIQAPRLPPSAVGALMHYAYVLGAPFDLASNPVEIKIEI